MMKKTGEMMVSQISFRKANGISSKKISAYENFKNKIAILIYLLYSKVSNTGVLALNERRNR
jgi:hypothetical protein